MTKTIIDSDITMKQALLRDPDKPAVSKEILEQLELVTVEYFSFDGELHRGQIVIHKELVDDTVAMFEIIVETKFPVSKVVPNSHPEYDHDTKKLVFDHNVTYSFGYRKVKNTDKLSLHAHGRAIDINPVQNPYIRYRDGKEIIFPHESVWRPAEPGTLHKYLEFIKFMEDRGWEWGGRWTKQDGVIDYMHLQKAK